MGTVGVAGDVAFGAFARVLPTKGKHVTAVTAPICSHVGERFKSMWNTMIDFLFVAILGENQKNSKQDGLAH
jgi:hypothetical protein